MKNEVFEDQFKLERIGHDDIEEIKHVYIWHIEDDEKDKFSFLPVLNHKIQYSESGLSSFTQAFRNNLKTTVFYILKSIDGSCLGFITISDYNPRNCSIETGYFFPKENRGKGYGKVIMSQLLKTIFVNNFFWKINKVYAETASNNIASIKLLERFGFHLDGTIREHYWFGEDKYDQLIYSLLRSEYPSEPR